VIQFTSLSGKLAGTEWVARRFPVRIGRSPPCTVRLDDDGVWDLHAEVRWVRKEGFVFAVQGEALASINGQSVQQAVLRNGDVIELGSARLLFSLGPTRQRSLRLREALTWLALIALCAGQAALIYWLVG
jgi:pSer/pThr/pTyr-binding forkhead associated (FHA) protein